MAHTQNITRISPSSSLPTHAFHRRWFLVLACFFPRSSFGAGSWLLGWEQAHGGSLWYVFVLCRVSRTSGATLGWKASLCVRNRRHKIRAEKTKQDKQEEESNSSRERRVKARRVDLPVRVRCLSGRSGATWVGVLDVDTGQGRDKTRSTGRASATRSAGKSPPIGWDIMAQQNKATSASLRGCRREQAQRRLLLNARYKPAMRMCLFMFNVTQVEVRDGRPVLKSRFSNHFISLPRSFRQDSVTGM